MNISLQQRLRVLLITYGIGRSFKSSCSVIIWVNIQKSAYPASEPDILRDLEFIIFLNVQLINIGVMLV